jgi:hypothetical protein
MLSEAASTLQPMGQSDTVESLVDRIAVLRKRERLRQRRGS